jgi:hypothetical protein
VIESGLINPTHSLPSIILRIMPPFEHPAHYEREFKFHHEFIMATATKTFKTTTQRLLSARLVLVTTARSLTTSLLELSALGSNEWFDRGVGDTSSSEMLLCFTGLTWTFKREEEKREEK